MKSLKATTPGIDGHYHIAYIDDDNKVGAIALAEGHTHEVQWQPPTEEVPEQQDPMTGQIIPGQPAQPGAWIVSPSPIDGHTHEGFTDVATEKPKKKTEAESDVVSETLLDFKTAIEIEGPSREEGETAEDFYCGKQWSDTDASTLDALDRAHLTINHIERNIDQLSGYQREQRTDIKFSPNEEGDQKGADLLNIISKIDFSRCFYDREESKVFEDAAIVGCGNFNAYMNFSDDLRGVWTVERMPWTDVVCGEHEKEDLSDCEVLFKSKMYSRTKAKELWPKKADRIDGVFTQIDGIDQTSTHTTFASGQYENSTNSTPVPTTVGGVPLVDTIRKELRVIERWKYVYQPVTVIAFPKADFYFPAWNWKDEDIQAAKSLPEFFQFERNIKKIRITKICGDVLLSDENPAELPSDEFFVVRVYGKKRKGRFWGKVKPMIDPQREINKRHSQVIDIGNKMCAYGFYIDQSTFVDKAEEDKFIENSSSPGWVIKVASLDRRPIKEEGAQFPAALIQMLQIEKQELSDLANIVATPAGANESGFAFLQKQKQRLTGNQYFFDNLSFAKRKLGKLYIKSVQRYYSPERILRMIRSKNAGSNASIGGQAVAEWKDEDILALLEETDFSLYDVEVSESPYSATARTSTFILITELAKGGAQVPPEVLIRAADVPETLREQLLESYAQQAQAQKDAQEETANMEISKTLAARGIFTPKVKEMMGEDPQAQVPQGDPAQQQFQGDGGIANG